MRLLRVVLDTNVVVSAHLNSRGYERFALDAALARRVSLCVSAELLAEYADVLYRAKLRIEGSRAKTSLALIQDIAVLVQPSQRLSVAPDPDDNRVLECAAEAGADYLVTGNRRHFPPHWGATRV